MKRKIQILSLICLTLIAGSGFSQTQAWTAHQIPGSQVQGYITNPANGTKYHSGIAIAFAEILPPDAKAELAWRAAHNTTSSKRFPVIVHFHGIGERSDNVVANRGSTSQLTKLFSSGTGPGPYLANTSSALYGKYYKYPGGQDSTQVAWILPQCWGGYGYFYLVYANEMLEYIKGSMSHILDTNRIYFAGLSFGGGAVMMTLQDSLINSQVAAFSPHCAGYTAPPSSANYPLPNDWAYVARSGAPVWACHAYNDPTTDHGDPNDATNGAWYSDVAIRNIMANKPQRQPIYYRYNAATHFIWDRWLNPANNTVAWSLSNGGTGQFANGGIVEWMLNFTANRRQPRHLKNLLATGGP